MATSSAQFTSNVLCRYFVNNCCQMGDRCRYSHDRTSRGDNVCRFYLRGACSFGRGCRYDHTRPRSSAQSLPVVASSASNAEVASFVSKLRPSAPEFVPQSCFNDNSCDPAFSHISVPISLQEIQQQPKREYGNYANAISGLESKSNTMSGLCPYFLVGQCYYGDNCSLIHGIVCDMCDSPCLHPSDTQYNNKHKAECVAEHEKAMEAAFAEARSVDKQCGICMETIVEKPKARFGILQNCRHCFCLDCIRTWRQSQQFENKLVRSCPECRTHSDFVIPCTFWVEDETEKQALISDYKANTAKKMCKYFKAADIEQECPFGNKCFYRHETPDGMMVVGDSPRTIRRRRVEKQRRERRSNGRNSSTEMFMWDFLRHRHLSFDSEDDNRLERLLELDIELNRWSDSDESDDIYNITQRMRQFDFEWID